MPKEAQAQAIPHELLWELHSLGRATDDVNKCLRVCVRKTVEFFAADSAAVAVLGPSREPGRLLLTYPKSHAWSIAALHSLLESSLADLPRPQVFALLKRRERAWCALALSRPREAFTRAELKTLRRAAEVISAQIARIDATRLASVRARIDRKLIERLQPNDLFYQILHGIRSLTGYDHSSALYIFAAPIALPIDDDAEPEVQIVAELLKPHTKSPRVGATFDLSEESTVHLASGGVLRWHREGDEWSTPSGVQTGDLPQPFDSRSELGDYGRERAMILAPLVAGDALLGVLKIAFSEPHMAGSYEADLMGSFLPHIVVALQNSHRFDHLQNELAAARKFQMGLLPAFETRAGDATIFFRSRPCEQLGGDFFDVVPLGDGRAMILLTDVSGHGAMAAMPTALIKAAFRDQAESHDPGKVLAAIWKGLRFFDASLLVTALCVEIDAAANVLRYSNAGHPAPLLFAGRGAIEELGEADPPIFPLAQGVWTVHEMTIQRGSRLLGYTDGIIESEHASREFGRSRLEAAIRESEGASRDLLDEILDAFDRHRGGRDQEDDCTLFLVAFD
jgi:hypothetical protein